MFPVRWKNQSLSKTILSNPKSPSFVIALNSIGFGLMRRLLLGSNLLPTVLSLLLSKYIIIYYIEKGFWGFGVLGFWGFGVLGFWVLLGRF